MIAFRRLSTVLLLPAALALPAYLADPSPAVAQTAREADPLRAVLQESRDQSRGVAFHANGTTINAIVVSFDDKFVIAKSQQSSRIVIRLDRVDGVSANF